MDKIRAYRNFHCDINPQKLEVELRAVLVVVVFVVCVIPTAGQTVSELELKYGKPIPVYSVGEHIGMTPEFASDGQVCRIALYPKHTAGSFVYLGTTLPFPELRDLLNSLVPPDKRGSKMKLNFGVTVTGGPAAWTTYPYEKVMFTFITSISKSSEYPLLRRGEFQFSISPKDYVPTPESSVPSADDFIRMETSKTEVVTIEWSDRKCQP